MLDWVMIMLLCAMLWERVHPVYMVDDSMGIFSFRNRFSAPVSSSLFVESQLTGISGVFCLTTVLARFECNS